jgi:hypothetical protein
LTSGALVCVKPSPTPSSQGTTTDSTQDQKTASNGDVTTKKTDVITKTVCLAGACTTTVTTNKTTVVNNAAGDKIGSSGDCKGPLCASSTNPDADGDGLGDCIKDCGEEEEENAKASSSESCDAAPVCEGDKFQCALLLQVHYNSCEERRPFTDKEKQDVDQAISKSFEDYEDAQSKLDADLGGYFSGFKQAASASNSSGVAQCLPDKTFPFIGQSITLPFSLVCPYLELFRIALIAVAYLAAARIIHTQI